MEFRLTLGDTVTPRLSARYWNVETVAAAFTDVRQVQPELSEQGRARFGNEYWEDLLRCPPSVFLEGWKA